MIYKFRFWVEKAQKMASWEMMKKECDRLSILDKEGFIPMMFTGLLDKNGVEIYYDCDKVVFEYLDRERGSFVKLIGILHFNVEEQRAEFNIEPDKRYPDYVCLSYNFMKMRNLEVIGSKFENPELLKGE